MSSSIIGYRGRLLFLFLLVLPLSLPAGTAQAEEDGLVEVAVGIPPIAFFVERIGGEKVIVQTMLAPGQSPTVFDPSPRDMARLSSTDVYFKAGVPFEKQLAAKVERTFPELQIVDLRPVSASSAKAGGESHDHHDPHYWLNPASMLMIADTICAYLSQIADSYSPEFQLNLKHLKRELGQLDSMISAKLEPYRGREFWVFHPAYDHFAEAYGLKQVALEREGKEPSGKVLAQLIEEARKKKVSTVFAQPQFANKVVATFARDIDATVVTLDPLAHDYCDNLNDIAEQIASALAKGGGQD